MNLKKFKEIIMMNLNLAYNQRDSEMLDLFTMNPHSGQITVWAVLSLDILKYLDIKDHDLFKGLWVAVKLVREAPLYSLYLVEDSFDGTKVSICSAPLLSCRTHWATLHRDILEEFGLDLEEDVHLVKA